MSVKKSVVCLANSFRPGGSCVAGIEFDGENFGQWIRPVSNRDDQAISVPEKTYEDGTQLAMLDIVQMTFDKHKPEGHQTENWVISEGVRWKKLGKLNPAQIQPAVGSPTTKLWGIAGDTKYGLKDKLPAFFANIAKNSLRLIQPETAVVEVIRNDYTDKDALWVSFRWAGTKHKIKLTDPVQFARFNTGTGATHHLESPMLCISLAKVWEEQGTASKLVAGLIP